MKIDETRRARPGRLLFLALALGCFMPAAVLNSHPLTFNSTIEYRVEQPAAEPSDIFNWTGAAFDAQNIGGSGINADGGIHNGTANDQYTYIARDRPTQGQTFVTGNSSHGYRLESITIRIAGYGENNATGNNRTFWNLSNRHSPIILGIGRVEGERFILQSYQGFMAGDNGNPGSGAGANGPGTFMTFHLPFTVYLEPNTTYGFDFRIGNPGGVHFEWLGINDDAYPQGTAYQRQDETITRLAGDRGFKVNLTPLNEPRRRFSRPGTLHTQEDIDRMRAKIAAGREPWASAFQVLLSSPYNSLTWPAFSTEYIVRGPTGSNFTRSQQDAQLIYTLALIWHLTGSAAHANRAVHIANVWGRTLRGVTGDTNLSLAAGICGYLFAIAGDLLSPFPGWAEADRLAYNEMLMRVFYTANFDFLWRRHDTQRFGGQTHYRLNWDAFNMASMAAIGILTDNRAVYEQAIDYFKTGSGNGRIERAAWYVFPDGMATTEEMGRSQGHNFVGWSAMLYLCQMAWNQGDDLFGYDNKRVLRAVEYIAKFNLLYDVHETPWHRNTSLANTEPAATTHGRGAFIPMFELVYNHYVNIRGIDAPYSGFVAARMRPERWPNTAHHPSQVDWFGMGTLTHSREPISQGVPPSGLRAHWSRNGITLSWWGTAHATGYHVKRSTTSGGPFTIIATIDRNTRPHLPVIETWHIDTDVTDGKTYYYVVSAMTPSGETTDSTKSRVAQELVSHYLFNGDPNDAIRDRHGELYGGSTGLPRFTAGRDGGQSIELDGIDDYVQLPVGIANHQEITIATWVFWRGGGNWQRIFDFGSEIEKSMFLTPSNGSRMRFMITTTRGHEGSGILETTPLPTNRWVHVAVTLGGGTGVFYVNGQAVNTAVIDKVEPLFGQVFCYIGRSMWNPDPHFNGRVDDFRIYNYALSAAEVGALFQHGRLPPRPPTGVRVTPRVDGKLEITWNPSFEASTYNVWRASDGGPFKLIADGITGTSYIDSTTSGAGAYIYRITAGNAVGESPPSTEVSFEVALQPIPAGPRVRSVEITGANFTVSLPSVPGYHYQLQWRESLSSGQWENVSAPIIGAGNEVELTAPIQPAAAKGFYRVIISPSS